MSKHRITAFFPFCDDEMAVDITYTYTRGRPAVMYLRNGDPGYPADPDEVELVSATVEEGVTLPEVWQKRLTDWATEWLADEGYAQACERASEREYDI